MIYSMPSMSLNFLSGFLLTVALLAILGYAVKEVLADRVGDFGQMWHRLRSAAAHHAGSEAKPVNDHLIGLPGTVVAHSDDVTRPMRVRLSHEFWPARSDATAQNQLPVGTPIKVIAVDGLTVVVETDAGRGKGD